MQVYDGIELIIAVGSKINIERILLSFQRDYLIYRYCRRTLGWVYSTPPPRKPALRCCIVNQAKSRGALNSLQNARRLEMNDFCRKLVATSNGPQ